MKDIVYLNGKFVHINDAHISVLDRGFLYGDGVYEVIPSYNEQFFGLASHMQRLKRSLEATKIPMPDVDFEETFNACREKNNSPDDAIYCQITRGAGPARVLLAPDKLTPTVFIGCFSAPLQPTDGINKGVHAITTPDARWQHCNIKAITLLPNVLSRIAAADQDAIEAIMIRDGLVTECCASNVFIVKNNTIMTPPKSNHILGGITREFIIELANANNMACQETNITEDELSIADEIWITSSTRGISPVVSLNNKPVGTGNAGPLWAKMAAILQQYEKTDR